jgi:hypothetical protein
MTPKITTVIMLPIAASIFLAVVPAMLSGSNNNNQAHAQLVDTEDME